MVSEKDFQSTKQLENDQRNSSGTENLTENLCPTLREKYP